MKILYILPMLILVAGCSSKEPCLLPNEAGTVVEVEPYDTVYCSNTGCSEYNSTALTLLVRDNIRMCHVPNSTIDMFRSGEVIKNDDPRM